MSYTENAKKMEESISKINDNYNFVYFKPNSPNITETDTNMCYTASEYGGSTLNMVPIEQILGTSSALHTKDTCKFNAGLIQKEKTKQDQINLQNITRKPGLNFKLVRDYFANNVAFFLDSPQIAQGITDDFTNISTAINASITDSSPYSVEWTGFFIPSQSGTWEFSIASDGVSLLWIGDNATNDYTVNNSFIHNQNSHGTHRSSSFIVNKLYPIRIQYGSTGGNKFGLTITSPDRKLQNTKQN